MSLDRIKGAVVKGVTSALVGRTIQNHTQPAIEPKRQVYTPEANRIFHPVNALIHTTLREIFTLQDSGRISFEQGDHIRQALLENLVPPTDSVAVAQSKLDNINAARGLLGLMARGKKTSAAVPEFATMPHRQLSGRGAYTWRNFGRDAMTGAGTAAGGALGALAGARTLNPRNIVHAGTVGGALGGGLGSELGGLIFGRGAYTVAKNSLHKSGSILSEGVEVPQFIESSRYTRITHREFVQDIVVPGTAATFTNNTFVINPGNTALFPWLSSIANNYQQYEIMGMVMVFKSTSTDFSTSGALGTVILATNYDVLEAPFASKVIMENSQYAVSAKPSISQIHAVECDPRLSSIDVKYIRNPSSSTSVSQDARFYDHGLFELATVGLSATAGTVLGELWVSYDIKLIKPEITNSAILTTGQRIEFSGSVSKTNCFGTPVYTGSQFLTAAVNTLTFQRLGEYMVTYVFSGGTVVDPAESTTLGSFGQLQSNTSGSVVINVYRVICTAVGQTLAFDHTASGSVTSGNMRITSYQYSLA
jgi:hypothetical protein